jgi:hypothetical protein
MRQTAEGDYRRLEKLLDAENAVQRQYLREDMAALDGECIVVGSLQRRLKAGERYSILDALGMGGLPRAERRKAERDMKKDMPDSVVSAPAALITPLAIYR